MTIKKEILRYLCKNPEGLNQSKLAKAMDRSSSAISQQIRALAKEGLVKRTSSGRECKITPNEGKINIVYPDLFKEFFCDNNGFTKTCLELAGRLIENRISLSTLSSRCSVRKSSMNAFVRKIEKRTGKTVVIIDGKEKIINVVDFNLIDFKDMNVSFLST